MEKVSVRESCRSISSRALAGVAFVALAASSTRAHAGFNIGGEATAQYEYDSNVFDLPSGVAAPGTSKHDDWFQAYGATLQADDLFDQDKLYATLNGMDYRYNNFTQLNHTEYTLDGGLLWKSGSTLDGKVDVTRSRTMVPFVDLLQTQISIATEQRETAQIGWLFMPEWKVQGTIYYDTLDQPIVGQPDLKLTDKSGQLGFNYVGFAGLSAGISGAYMRGTYSGAAAGISPNFNQETADFDVNWAPTAYSTFTGQAGYSRRTSDFSAQSTSGPTGNIQYKNQITPKTSFNVGVQRSIISYVSNNGAELVTNYTTGAVWQATFRISVLFDYGYNKSNLPDQGTVTDPNRIDHFQFADLKIDYQPLHWLWLEPYVRWQNRTSTFAPVEFSSSSVGLTFNLLWHCPNNKCEKFQ
jgi:hypothetical protein